MLWIDALRAAFVAVFRTFDRMTALFRAMLRT